jgi:hypothetical protein
MKGYKQTKVLVKKIVEKGYSPLILGDRGIGKTTVAFDIAKDLNLDPFYLNVSQVSPESLVFPIPKDSFVDLRTPDLDHKLVILDELTNRNPEIHSLLQSLVLDKRLGSTQYHDLHFIATGNRPEDSILAIDLPRPLVERFVLIDAPIPTKEEWASYSLQKEADYRFVNFILQSPDSYYYRKSDPEGLDQIPSPRNNTRTSIIVKDVDDLDELFILVSGSSGKDVATAFIEFVKQGRFYSYNMFRNNELPKNDSEVLVLVLDAVNSYKDTPEIIKVFEYLDSSNYKKFRPLLFTTIKEVKGPSELDKILRSGHSGISKFITDYKKAIMS